MRGYIAAVEAEQGEAILDYEAAIVDAYGNVAKLQGKGKSSLGRVRRNGS